MKIRQCWPVILAGICAASLLLTACQGNQELALSVTHSAETITSYTMRKTAEAFIYANQTATAKVAKTPGPLMKLDATGIALMTLQPGIGASTPFSSYDIPAFVATAGRVVETSQATASGGSNALTVTATNSPSGGKVAVSAVSIESVAPQGSVICNTRVKFKVTGVITTAGSGVVNYSWLENVPPQLSFLNNSVQVSSSGNQTVVDEITLNMAAPVAPSEITYHLKLRVTQPTIVQSADFPLTLTCQ